MYDYREHPKDKSSQGQHHPREHFPIHIPYISPLVLRKEMENVLGKHDLRLKLPENVSTWNVDIVNLDDKIDIYFISFQIV